MKEDVKLYTIRHIAEQLALLEEHLKEFSQGAEEVFCLECEIKHVLLLNGYAKECLGFTCKPESLIEDIKKWADDLSGKLKDLTREQALQVASEARNFRKELGKELMEDKIATGGHLKER